MKKCHFFQSEVPQNLFLFCNTQISNIKKHISSEISSECKNVFSNYRKALTDLRGVVTNIEVFGDAHETLCTLIEALEIWKVEVLAGNESKNNQTICLEVEEMIKLPTVLGFVNQALNACYAKKTELRHIDCGMR